MFDMEITSLGSGALVASAACAGGTGDGTGDGALSLQAASARASRMRGRTRIGARKIAEPFPVDKEQARGGRSELLGGLAAGAGPGGRCPLPRALQELLHRPGLLLGIAQQRGGARSDRRQLPRPVALTL